MKYNFKEEPKRLFYGVTETVDMNFVDSTPFAEIWSKAGQEFDMKYYKPISSIGLERYPFNFMETRQFTYSALYPINTTEGLDEKKIVEVPEGKYIRFETTFGELVKGYIPKVYDYIRENNIPVNNEFDYEEYPPSFNHQDPDSIVYVCFLYKGE